MDPVSWGKNHVPVSTRFDDPYYSLDDGLAEARHVFLAGNGLPQRFCPGFCIGELGFGTGLNCLAAWAAWEGDGPLSYVGFERFPLSKAALAMALAPWPELQPLATELLDVWDENGVEARLPGLELTVIVGDANQTLAAWPGAADAWFLDGFSPAKNPELWGAELMAEVARHTRPGGSFATYTAAGHVRAALGDAGFEVERRPGFGRKRHMTQGVLR